MHKHHKLILIGAAALGYYLAQPGSSDALDPILAPLPVKLGLATSPSSQGLAYAAECAGIAFLAMKFIK